MTSLCSALAMLPALRSTRPEGGRGRRAPKTIHAPTNQRRLDQSLGPEAAWRDLHGSSGFGRFWHTHGGVSTALPLRSTRPEAGQGGMSHRTRHAPQTNASSRPAPRPRGGVERPPRHRHARLLPGTPAEMARLRFRTPGVLVPFGHSAPFDTTRGRGEDGRQSTPLPPENGIRQCPCGTIAGGGPYAPKALRCTRQGARWRKLQIALRCIRRCTTGNR